MRIRSIKPEFWRSDDIAAFPIHTRLTFIGLWSYVDDNGVGLDKLVSIVADLYADDFSRDPLETVQRVTEDLERLARGGQVVRYRAAHHGRIKDLFYITKWRQHQVVNHPSKGAEYPLPPAELIEESSCLKSVSGDSQETLTHEQGSRGAGEHGAGEVETCATSDESDPPSSFKAVYPTAFELWWDAYPRKEAKRRALAAWKNATKRACEEDLIHGALRYATDPNRVGEYTKHPATWLNGDGWLDEPLPARNNNSHAPVHKLRSIAELAQKARAAENAQLAATQLKELECSPSQMPWK